MLNKKTLSLRPGLEQKRHLTTCDCTYGAVRLRSNDRATDIAAMRLDSLAFASPRWPTLFPNHSGPRKHRHTGKA